MFSISRAVPMAPGLSAGQPDSMQSLGESGHQIDQRIIQIAQSLLQRSDAPVPPAVASALGQRGQRLIQNLRDCCRADHCIDDGKIAKPLEHIAVAVPPQRTSIVSSRSRVTA